MEKLYNTSQKKVNGSTNVMDLSPEVRPEIRIVVDEEGFDELEQQWSDLAEVAESTVFQTYEWNRTWWKHYGEAGKLHLIIFSLKNRLIGIAPFFRDSINFLGFQGYLCLRFLGSDVSQPTNGGLLGLISYTDYLDFVIRPGFEDAVYRSLLEYIITCNIDYDEILLDVVPQNSTVWSHLVPKLQKQGFRFLVDERTSSQIINLQGSWDGYLKSLSKNRRSHVKRSLKKIFNSKKQIFKEFDVKKEEDVLPFFERLVEFHQTRWNRFGFLGTFAERNNYEFHKEISLIFYKKGWLQLKALQSVEDEESVAIDLNYRFKNRHYGIHSSLNMDSKYYSYGPGSALLNVSLKEVSESQHLECYDFLRGAEDYKLRLSNQTMRNRRIVILNADREKRFIAGIAKHYAYLKRRLYREWKQFLMLIETRPFWEASTGYARASIDRVKTKFD